MLRLQFGGGRIFPKDGSGEGTPVGEYEALLVCQRWNNNPDSPNGKQHWPGDRSMSVLEQRITGTQIEAGLRRRSGHKSAGTVNVTAEDCGSALGNLRGTRSTTSLDQ